MIYWPNQLIGFNMHDDDGGRLNNCYWSIMWWPWSDYQRGGGWGCEVSCGGHHRPRWKTTTGSALDGAVFDIAQILAYLVHNMSRSQFPHSAFARGPRSPALEEGMRVAMGATCECCAGPYAWCSIYVHWFLLISTSDIKRYNNLYLSFHRRW